MFGSHEQRPDWSELSDFDRSVVAVLYSTGPGDVMSYGEVAAEAGFPGAARAVGTLLKRLDDLPWWRIVNSVGRLVPGHEVRQGRHLAVEGVTTRNGRVSGFGS